MVSTGDEPFDVAKKWDIEGVEAIVSVTMGGSTVRHMLPIHSVSARVMGMKSATHEAIIEAVKVGLPVDSIQVLEVEYNATRKELADVLNIKPATMTRRIKSKSLLRTDESDRVLRLARLKEQALEMTLGDNDAAITWLRTPQSIFNDETPMQHAATELGAKDVEDLIGRIQYGVFS